MEPKNPDCDTAYSLQGGTQNIKLLVYNLLKKKDSINFWLLSRKNRKKFMIKDFFRQDKFNFDEESIYVK